MVHLRELLSICLLNAAFGFSPSVLPEYCSDYIGENRNVPPLDTNELQVVSSLAQVQLLMRHGARIPWTSNRCWHAYNVSWTGCDVHVVEAPSVAEQGPPIMQFRKIYDGTANAIPGTCQVGQLLHAGYTQAQEIGRIFREHYVGLDSMHLFSERNWEHIDPSSVYFQSDDEERTLLTTQAFLQSFFETTNPTVVNFHTGDDIPPAATCPGLQQLAADAFSSEGFRLYNKTAGAALEREGDAVFGRGSWSFSNIFDCLMTTVCTKRDIPQMTNAFFARLFKFSEEVNAYKYVYNNGAYAKLYSGPILGGVAKRLQAAVEELAGAIRFSVRGMHDSDISGILAILLGDQWDRRWPPYASTLIVELYRPQRSPEMESLVEDYFVRVIYNGVVLNLSCAVCFGKPEVCTSFCRAKKFIDIISPLPMTTDACESVGGSSPSGEGGDSHDWFSSPFMLVISLYFVGVLCGVLGTTIVAKKVPGLFRRNFEDVAYTGIEMSGGEPEETDPL